MLRSLCAMISWLLQMKSIVTFYTGKKHHSLIGFARHGSLTIHINGFKAYATLRRLGYCCGPEEILAQMVKIHQFVIMAAPNHESVCGQSILQEEDVEMMRDCYNQRRRYLIWSSKRLGHSMLSVFLAPSIFPEY